MICAGPDMQRCNDRKMPVIYKSLRSYFVLIHSPFAIIQNGSGASARAIKPSKLLPQPKPRASYIDNPANGRTAPATDRTTVLAARLLAAKMVNASTRYLLYETLAPASQCSTSSPSKGGKGKSYS